MIKLSLAKIQQELKAPKNQFNKFGGYKYRNAEDILESVKPLLKEHDCVLTLCDEIVNIGARFYVRATATLTDTKENESVIVSALAREEEIKKGMDGSQITGASSSYARKYALNGLFLIDDTKDSDFTNTHDKPEKSEDKPKTRSFNDRLTACKTFEDVTAVYQEMNEDERKENYNLMQIIKRRIYKDNFDSILKNMKKNHWTDKKQIDLEDMISHEPDEKKKNEMIAKLEERVKSLGFEYKYEVLPWE